MADRRRSKDDAPVDAKLIHCKATQGNGTVATTKLSVSSKTSDGHQNNSDSYLVKETHRIYIDYDPVSGRKTLNTYVIIRELGRGEHGRVKLAFDVTQNIYVAVKLLNRKDKPRLGRPQGSSTEEKIHREIAILKKCSHPNVVRLIEVLDDEKSRKIYLVLEYCEKGEIRWQTPDGKPCLSREQARSASRHVVLGLEYLHMKNIIHRDIKPANLLVSDENVVKISDFGVSYEVSSEMSAKSHLELAKTVGTPAFFSPELCLPTEVRENGERKSPAISSKVDVWAFGVTLFCFLYGYLPFEADNEYELFRVIANSEIEFPDPAEDEDLALANELLQKLLTKDPHNRPSMTEIKSHPWLLKNLSVSDREVFLNKIENGVAEGVEEVPNAAKCASISSRIKKKLGRIAEQMTSSTKHKPKSVEERARILFRQWRFAGKKQSFNGENALTHSSTSKGSSSISQLSDPISQTSLPPLPTYNKFTDEFSACHGSLNSVTDQSLDSLGSNSSLENLQVNQHQLRHSQARSQCIGTAGAETSPTSMGLMPMHLADDYSLSSSLKQASLECLNLSGSSHVKDTSGQRKKSSKSQYPKLDIPRTNNEDLWDDQIISSSSSEDDDSGELTLVVGRDRTRSIESSARYTSSQ